MRPPGEFTLEVAIAAAINFWVDEEERASAR
jgi:hypothetical protein